MDRRRARRGRGAAQPAARDHARCRRCSPRPYTPSSRRFGTPLALRITDLDAYARADAGRPAAEVDALRPETAGGRIEHDRVWAAKRAALELLWRSDGRPEPRDVGADLWEFATFCALAERYGARWSRWPAALRRPDGPGSRRRGPSWPRASPSTPGCSSRCSTSSARCGTPARAAGVRVVHDLAVGLRPGGRRRLGAAGRARARACGSGAPPDAFSQQGQDWGLPPWRPDRLAATGYAAYRDLLRALLRQADGLRIDHVAGLWRLWWVPPGESADRGTYVHYDAEVMLAVLTLEAHRAGALVIGEDLGTVEPEVTDGLAERRMLGSSVLWFTRDLRRARPAAAAAGSAGRRSRWPPSPPTTCRRRTGFLRGEHVRARAELGLLDDVAAEEARAEADRPELRRAAAGRGAGRRATEPGEDQLVVALHALLARSRWRLVLVSPYDVVGEVRQPNLPGTVDEYPNWRLPLPVSLEELRADPRVRVVTDTMRRHRP